MVLRVDFESKYGQDSLFSILKIQNIILERLLYSGYDLPYFVNVNRINMN